MISNEVVLAIIGVLTVIAGAWAHGYRKDQDRKTLAMQAEIERAKEDANETQALLGITQKMLARMEAAELMAAEERKVWTKTVSENAEAKAKLTQSIERNTGIISSHGARFDEMQEQFSVFQAVVSNQFEAFKRQIDTGLSEERLNPILDAVFDRFIKRLQGVIVHAPQIATAKDDTLNLKLDSKTDVSIPSKRGEKI